MTFTPAADSAPVTTRDAAAVRMATAEKKAITEPAPANARSAKRPPNGQHAGSASLRELPAWRLNWASTADQFKGTGRDGRVRERDIQAAAKQQGSRLDRQTPSMRPPRVRSPKSTSFRRTIAARMLEGSQQTAPVTLTTTADATNFASLRAQFKATAQSPGEVVPSYTDLMIKLVARALQEFPELNQQWADGQIVSPDGIHIAVAVDTPAGLLAPVVRDVPGLGLREIAARTHDLKLRAAASRLERRELSGGTFTVSNLGAFGIDAFTPIINVPQCAILGMGRIARRPTVVGDQIVARDAITLSLTFDHRIVDGAPAARFLAALSKAIENPGPWLVF